ncbi:MAG: tRNA pseudouridine(55) synthase TruB [Cyanobacteria bacterium SZAS LIN-2]|nr:tRNA pseudouridine(55) synthase TruB [Cyanobacteria bacterium SZAS LIN-2]
MVKSNPAQATKQLNLATAFLNIDKPQGITSHDVVHRVRKLMGIKQVGHAGTLDPMATGVMVVALGKATRLLRFLADDKTYLATIQLGLVTDTDDIEGKVLEDKSSQAAAAAPSAETVAAALTAFRGDIAQIPPYYSAIHVDGKRLYEMARAGMAPPELKPRPVTIHTLDLVAYEPPFLTVRVHCSKGTYIRSIARDLGNALGLGGTLSALRRETSGRFNLSQAQELEQLQHGAAPKTVAVEEALALPAFNLSAELAKRLSMGQKIALSDLDFTPGDQDFFLISSAGSGKPFCIGRIDSTEVDGQMTKCLAPEVVFADV